MSKTILITGASSGIGKATAKYFHEKGWNVVATMRKPEREEELTQLDNVLVTRLDVQDLLSINSAVNEGIEKFGKIDVVLNNAGYGAYGPLEATPREKIIRQFEVNVLGLLDVTKAVIPHFRKNRDGMIINIASIGGQFAFPLGTLYHGTKFAVEGLSEALHFEMEQIGCKVKIIEPGMIRTDFGGRSFDFTHDESLVEYQETVDKLFAAFGTFTENASDPVVVAEVIYKAATDGTDRLRYTAGDDAQVFMANRREQDDETFMAGVRAMIDL